MGLGSFLEIPVEITHAFRSCMHAFISPSISSGAFTVTLQPHPLIRLILTFTTFWLNSRGEGLGLLHVFTHLPFFFFFHSHNPCLPWCSSCLLFTFFHSREYPLFPL